jgi:hypothetical protein
MSPYGGKGGTRFKNPRRDEFTLLLEPFQALAVDNTDPGIGNTGNPMVKIIGKGLGRSLQSLLGNVGVNIKQSRDDGFSLSLYDPGAARINLFTVAKDGLNAVIFDHHHGVWDRLFTGSVNECGPFNHQQRPTLLGAHQNRPANSKITMPITDK